MLVLALTLAACAPAGFAPAGAYGVTYPTATSVAAAVPAQTAPAAAPSSTPAAPAQTAVVPVTGGASIQVVTDPKLGQILANAAGMTLYTFALDTPGASKCDTACTAYWPPEVATAAPSAPAGIQAQVGTIKRSDGSLQVTFNGMPLYTYLLDSKPGDVQGDGVDDFGGIWHAAGIAASTGSAGGNAGGYH